MKEPKCGWTWARDDDYHGGLHVCGEDKGHRGTHVCGIVKDGSPCGLVYT